MYQREVTAHDGYELFRRAVVDRADDAWAEIYARYRPLLLVWARQSCARSASREHAEDIADRALARAWAALSPDRFARFPNVATLMAYLRNCVAAAAIDSSRAAANRERAYQRLDTAAVATPEDIVVDASSRGVIWQLVSGLVVSEQERVVLDESFALALAPRQIYERHPDLFASVAVVYGVKRNLLSRLGRCSAIQRLREDLLVA